MSEVPAESNEPLPIELEELVDLAHSMRELAEAGDWVAVSKNESRRREMLASFCSGPISRGDPVVVTFALRRILESDRKLSMLARTARDEVVRQLRSTTKGRRAARSYHQNSR